MNSQKGSHSPETVPVTPGTQTFHIRKQLAKRGGNQFYRDKSIREAGTLCGEPVTINDIPFKGTVDRSWLANHFPGFEPCSKCLAIRGTQ